MATPRNLNAYTEQELAIMVEAGRKWIYFDFPDQKRLTFFRHRIYGLRKLIEKLDQEKAELLRKHKELRFPYTHPIMEYAYHIVTITTMQENLRLWVGGTDAANRPKNKIEEELKEALGEQQIPSFAQFEEEARLAKQRKLKREQEEKDGIFDFKIPNQQEKKWDIDQMLGSKPKKETTNEINTEPDFDWYEKEYGIKETELNKPPARENSGPERTGLADETSDEVTEPALIKEYPGGAQHKDDGLVYFPNGSTLPFVIFEAQLKLLDQPNGKSILENKIKELQNKKE